MRTYWQTTLALSLAVLAASPAFAARGQMEKASIKAASDCVAKAALNNPNIETLYRENRLKEVTDWIVLKSNACENSLRAMRLLHDEIYGEGKGQAFLYGDYLADLPRAVRERIKVVLESDIVGKGSPFPPVPREPPSIACTAGAELMIIGVAANDVLNIREDPTERSRIIGMIPPDTRGGVVCVGDSQDKWIFVRYDDVEGWVDSRFVRPVTRRGQRLDATSGTQRAPADRTSR
jgi:uncharacterized protein YgiM (DUF1202 family)